MHHAIQALCSKNQSIKATTRFAFREQELANGETRAESKASVTVWCPNPPCKVTRTLPGQIMQLSVETALGVWTAVDLTGLIYPTDQG